MNGTAGTLNAALSRHRIHACSGLFGEGIPSALRRPRIVGIAIPVMPADIRRGSLAAEESRRQWHDVPAANLEPPLTSGDPEFPAYEPYGPGRSTQSFRQFAIGQFAEEVADGGHPGAVGGDPGAPRCCCDTDRPPRFPERLAVQPVRGRDI